MSDGPARVSGDQLVKPSPMRKAIVAAMTMSAAVPQFTLDADVDCGALMGAREAAAGRGVPASLSDVLIAACADTLSRHPDLNSVWTDEGILRRREINIGTALALDDGLVVPVVRGANRRSLRSISEERMRLATAARDGALTADDVFTGSFTISNLGTLGIRRFRALVQPGQAAILAVGSVTQRALVLADKTVSQQLMTLTLSCDHRAVDGAPAARFLGELVACLEDAGWLQRVLNGDLTVGGGGRGT